MELFRSVVVLCAVVGGARGQVEQAVFAQLYYPPVRGAAAARAGVAREASATPPPAPELSVRPLPPRARRSAFDVDTESNDAALRRLRHKMKDPNWVPEIRPRSNVLDD